MEASLIQNLFSFMTNNIFLIMYGFALVELYLVFSVHRMLKQHENVLADISDNLLKGFSDAPDKDSASSVSERIEASLEFITNKITMNPELRRDFGKNANKVSQRSLYNRHYKIEIYASVMSALVQTFTLLGILGTILAIAQSAFQGGGQIDVSTLSSAFVLAMDTTILGITFSIIFMVIESTFQPKIERVINESAHFKQIVSNINLL